MQRNFVKTGITSLIIGLVAALSYLLYSNIYNTNKNIVIKKIKPVKTAWGINIDTLDLTIDTIQEGQNLSTILIPYGISNADVEKIASSNTDVFDVRKIKGGNQYQIIHTKGKQRKGLHFIYIDSDTTYYIIDLAKNFKAIKFKKEIKTVQKEISGVIKGSLWNTFESLNIDPELALQLSDIYQWSIDFYAIQENDLFKLIYDEKFVDGKSVGFGKIHAAWFCASGDSVYAIPFPQDSTISYFNLDGTSLRKAFLKAPLKFRRISSGYTNSRLHPILRISRPHHGVDYSAPSGTPVSTIGDGTVIHAGWSGGGGKTIKIKHSNGYVTSYMHLSGFAKGIRNGTHVQQGEVIGYVGSTGLSTGPHLDFRVYLSGKPINPLKMTSPPSYPVKKDDMAKFKIISDSLKTLLHRIELTKVRKAAA